MLCFEYPNGVCVFGLKILVFLPKKKRTLTHRAQKNLEGKSRPPTQEAPRVTKLVKFVKVIVIESNPEKIWGSRFECFFFKLPMFFCSTLGESRINTFQLDMESSTSWGDQNQENQSTMVGCLGNNCDDIPIKNSVVV